MKKEFILIGDKVLIEPESDKDRTDGGLYLPQGIKEREKVQHGRIIKTGPGYPVIDSSFISQDPWVQSSSSKYFPLQAEVGDLCVFLKDQGYEVYYEKRKYFIVSHSAILMIVRDDSNIGGVKLT